MTTTEYDLSKVKEALQQVLMTSVIISAIHYKWGYGTSLFFPILVYEVHLASLNLK